MRTLNVTSNASGAYQAGKHGDIVVIVDVIDMSTTAESLTDAGVLRVFGASPDKTRAAEFVAPEKIGYIAGKYALERSTGIVLVSEPRVGSNDERLARVGKALRGIELAGASIEQVLPNMGAEVAKYDNLAGKVAVIVSDTGGVAYDAAFQGGAPYVTTATIARTMCLRGEEPAQVAAKRAMELALKFNTGISVVAASANSLEDVLAAEYIAKVIINKGFLNLATIS